ncbi:hypothetical protein OSTOST_06675 [Ostertagia ostertagi]
MARRGLHMRKPSDVANKANIAHGTSENAGNVQGLVRKFDKVSLGENNERNQDGTANKEEDQRTTTDRDSERNPSKKVEERSDSRFFDRLLKSIGLNGFWFSTSHVKYHRAGIFWRVDLESAHSDFLACYPSTTKSDWHALGGYRTFALTNLFIADVFYSQRLPTEVLPLAAYLVAVTVSKRHVKRDQLESLSVAAVRLATKVESQHSLCEEVMSEFDAEAVDAHEIQICRATDFRFLVCTTMFFMRLVHKLVQQHSWQWSFAKFASQLALCQMELATLRPPLLAGVVMRLTCLLAGDDNWTSECYDVIGEDEAEYDFPQAILCRLILFQHASSYTRYLKTVDHAVSIRPGWIEEQAAAANCVKMLGNHVFG